jgi:hypothetical protein
MEKLANDIVEGWDMDCLIGFAVDTLVDDFKTQPEEEFEEEWNNFYNPEDEE